MAVVARYGGVVVVLMELGLLPYALGIVEGAVSRDGKVGWVWRICVWKGSEEGDFCLCIGIVGRHISSIGRGVIDGDGRVSFVLLVTR